MSLNPVFVTTQSHPLITVSDIAEKHGLKFRIINNVMQYIGDNPLEKASGARPEAFSLFLDGSALDRSTGTKYEASAVASFLGFKSDVYEPCAIKERTPIVLKDVPTPYLTVRQVADKLGLKEMENRDGTKFTGRNPWENGSTGNGFVLYGDGERKGSAYDHTLQKAYTAERVAVYAGCPGAYEGTNPIPMPLPEKEMELPENLSFQIPSHRVASFAYEHNKFRIDLALMQRVKHLLPSGMDNRDAELVQKFFNSVEVANDVMAVRLAGLYVESGIEKAWNDVFTNYVNLNTNLQVALNAKIAHCQHLQSEIEGHKMALMASQEELEVAQTALDEQSDTLERHKNDKERLYNENVQLLERIDVISAERARLGAQVEQLEAESGEISASVSELETKVDGTALATVDAVKALLETLEIGGTAKVRDYEVRNKNLRIRCDFLWGENRALSNKLEQSQKYGIDLLEVSKSRVSELEGLLRDAKSQLTDRSNAELKRVSDANAQLQADNLKLQNAADKAISERQRVEREIASIRPALVEARETGDNYRKAWADAKLEVTRVEQQSNNFRLTLEEKSAIAELHRFYPSEHNLPATPHIGQEHFSVSCVVMGPGYSNPRFAVCCIKQVGFGDNIEYRVGEWFRPDVIQTTKFPGSRGFCHRAHANQVGSVDYFLEMPLIEK